jgi:hypothetical protein
MAAVPFLFAGLALGGLYLAKGSAETAEEKKSAPVEDQAGCREFNCRHGMHGPAVWKKRVRQMEAQIAASEDEGVVRSLKADLKELRRCERKWCGMSYYY